MKVKFEDKTTLELIEIVEHKEKYNFKTWLTANAVLETRDLSLIDVKRISIRYYRTKLKKMLENNLMTFDEYVLPRSYFLSKLVRLEIFKEEFDLFVKKRISLNPGMERYLR